MGQSPRPAGDGTRLALFAVLGFLGCGFACFQLIGALVQAQGTGPFSDRLMAWTLGGVAASVLFGWYGVITGIRIARAHRPPTYAATVGPSFAFSMPYLAIIPTLIVLGLPAGAAAVVVTIVVGLTARPVIAALTAPPPGYGAPPRAVRTEAVPAAVTSAAAVLGAHRITFGNDTLPNGRTDLGCGIVVALIAGGIGTLLARSGASQGWVVAFFVVCAALPVVVVIGLWTTRDELPERAWVFERGFVWGDRRRRLTAFPWSAIQSHRATDSFRIVRNDGISLKVSRVDLSEDDLSALGNLVDQQIAAARRPPHS
jgi:hypothetical protein